MRGKLYLAWLLLPVLATAEPLSLEQRVERLEQQVEQLSRQLQPAQPAAPPAQPEAPPGAAMAVSLKGWGYRPVQIKFNTYYALDLTLRNAYPQAIKEIDGRVEFKDRLGGHLYTINLSSNLAIPAGGEIVDQGSQQNKRMLMESHPFRKHPADAIKAELVIKKIIFADNTSLSF
jgi:hypothetical protein